MKELFQYKYAIVGIGILLVLIGISVYTVIAIPYEQATYLWRGGEGIWLDYPRNAMPSWINIFLPKKLPETIILDTQKDQKSVTKVIIPFGEKMSSVRIEFTFNYPYDDFPSEINLFYSANYNESSPHLTIYWIKPGGQEFKLRELTLRKSGAYYISNDGRLAQRLHDYLYQKIGKDPNYAINPDIGLFVVEDESAARSETVTPLKGKYFMVIEGTLFEKNSDVNVKLVVYGKVYGPAGTDHLRRDLSIALLWGTPIALSFGVIAALSIAMIQITIAAISAWFSGRIDFIVQKVTEVEKYHLTSCWLYADSKK